MTRFQLFYIAHLNALAMDRRGPPGTVWRFVVGLPLGIMFVGAAGVIVVFALSFGAWLLGLG